MSLQKFNDNQIAWGGDVHKLSYNLAERVVKSFDGRAEKGQKLNRNESLKAENESFNLFTNIRSEILK